MCIAPLTLPDGTEVACHECWQCRERRINDWVGRNIAESKTSRWARAVTLTYGRSRAGDADHERAVVLTYSDVQKWFKLLRRHGYPVRYFVTGEFGSTKGRAHWHVMLYGSGDMPEHALDDSLFIGAHWDHGYSFWTQPGPHAVRYNCKYIQKDMGDAERQGHLAMSKKPPLGAAYFARVAEQYVRQGLAPQDLSYRFPEVRRRKPDGSEEVVDFMLTERSAELFLEQFIRRWEATYPGRPLPPSDLVEEFMDRGAWNPRLEPEPAGLWGPDTAKPALDDLRGWMGIRQVEWNTKLRAWVAPGPPGSEYRMTWVFIKAKGAYGWRKVAANVSVSR